MKRHVKAVLFIAVCALVFGAWFFFGIDGIIASLGAAFTWVVGHTNGRRSGGSGNKPKGNPVREATERSDKAVTELQGEARLVRESLERSSVELGDAIESSSEASRQLDLALDILEPGKDGQGKGSPDRLH
jgi:hypothetical protein